jgi:hypothetical protein
MELLHPIPIEEALHIVKNNLQFPSVFIHENSAFHIEPVIESIRKIRTSTRDYKAPREDDILNDYVIIKKEDI